MPARSELKNAALARMDGAAYTGYAGKTPEDFMADPDTGRRPSEIRKPWGSSRTDLTYGDVLSVTLPPRSVWKLGKYRTSSYAASEWDVWIVPGEGTPGNYEQREYILPSEIAEQALPPHPADWPKKLKAELRKKLNSPVASAKPSESLPWGLRIRCVGCGHFFKMNDLSDHAKQACPSVQMNELGYVLYALECECCDTLQDTATIIDGFPIQIQKREEEPPSHVTVVNEGGDDGGSPTAP